MDRLIQITDQFCVRVHVRVRVCDYKRNLSYDSGLDFEYYVGLHNVSIYFCLLNALDCIFPLFALKLTKQYKALMNK